ncbi:hypothetical protein IEQ34_010441 [Dendrobium chrysotoxum]|uniref:Uncharacterized protein n=1 Tax=Dendrobium chrysotoxum TaxID=161865 RepID=A0AAV7H1G8_DENCH|nr:hypothetical protein IEQ34_010441 [Dendrobium chrysotoxum]
MEVGRTVVGGRQWSERPLSSEEGRKDHKEWKPVLHVLHFMDPEQHNLRSSIYLIILNFFLTAAFNTIYNWISIIYRRRRGHDTLQEFNGGAAIGVGGVR